LEEKRSVYVSVIRYVPSFSFNPANFDPVKYIVVIQEAHNLYDMLTNRLSLTRKLHQHKTVRVIEEM